MNELNIGSVRGLGENEQNKLNELVAIYNYHIAKNNIKERYYDGKISLNEVNIGIALPEGLKNFKIGCEWGTKAVDVLAQKSVFDGFVGADGGDNEELRQILIDNSLITQYQNSVVDELKYGCTFVTLSPDPETGCRIRFHSPLCAAALWNGEKGRIDYGLAIIDSVPDEKEESTWQASVIYFYTDSGIYVLSRNKQSSVWSAEFKPQKLGRIMMQPMIWNATSKKPFGRSRLKSTVRGLIDGYIRTVANATIGLEFATTPQKYLLGITDEQYDSIIDQKFKQYAGSLLLGTTNPETGQNPNFGQLTQGNIEPHVSMMRLLSTQFSAATGLTVTDVGVVNDANPTSSEAILAQSGTLIAMAEKLNRVNGDALDIVAKMALAIKRGVSLKELPADLIDFDAHFKNPAMPSIAATADAAVKIAGARQGFASTDTFLTMLGFDPAEIRRIKAEEQRERGNTILSQEFSGEVENDNIAG